MTTDPIFFKAYHHQEIAISLNAITLNPQLLGTGLLLEAVPLNPAEDTHSQTPCQLAPPTL